MYSISSYDPNSGLDKFKGKDDFQQNQAVYTENFDETFWF